jgi:integrase
MLSANEPVNDKAIELIRADAERAGSDPAGVQLLPHRTFHDRRRTAASHMARLGIALPVIEKLLAHTSGSFVGVYQRYEFVAEERAAIEAWGKWLTGLTADAAANDDALRAVVP